MLSVLLAVLLGSYLHLPYPNAQETLTVLGADKNGDGVRDDVESYIRKTYSSSGQARLRAALLEVARSAQALLHAAENESPKMAKYVKAYLGARNCVYSLFSEKAVDYLLALHGEIFNTPQRFELYLKASKTFNGQLYRVPDNPADVCKF